MEIRAEDAELLDRIVMRVQVHGANPVDPGTALTRPAPTDGVFPDDFYSTTNLDTFVRLDREWLPGGPRRDGLRARGRGAGRRPVVRNVPVSDVKAGERSSAARTASGWSCRPRRPRRGGGLRLHVLRRLQREAAGAAGPPDRRPDARGQGRRARRILWVGGPASCTPARRRPWCGWSAPATSTCSSPATRWPRTTSSRLFGTRSGVDLAKGSGRRTARAPHPGDQHDPAAGSIAAAVDVRRPHRRRDARDGAGRQGRSCWSARSATTARCPTSTPT